ncbi:hypothetical protein J2X20_002766 [Pelomonas saccharophila]|uniref:Uncharacterized protein n=1 Tax=Roseateles saccharophilus TaxID=304 RepID=A0ABU1YMM5_ROSSA|nr:hypothetical protein [Roseateles saccharophilus]MDR7270108.1 hypothetical protein [Roseateles saccharophilus]
MPLDTLPNSRAEFETFFLSSRNARRIDDLERREDGTYMHRHTQRHWWTWQCARAKREWAGASNSSAK